MDTEKKIRSFEQFKQAWGKTKHYKQLAELHQNRPETYDSYLSRMKKEQLKESGPVSYYLQYGGNLTAKEV